MSAGVDTKPHTRRVQVLFGPHVIAEYAATPELADQYVEVMRGHFVGLELSVDDRLTGTERPLPAARLWDTVAP